MSVNLAVERNTGRYVGKSSSSISTSPPIRALTVSLLPRSIDIPSRDSPSVFDDFRITASSVPRHYTIIGGRL